MRELSRVELFTNLAKKEIVTPGFKDVLTINNMILSGIEELFLSTDAGMKRTG